jgi:hypothetical protein
MSATPKKNRPPKGYAELPQWWLDITPHNVLNIEEDAARRKNDYQEAAKYANLAAKADWEQTNDSKYTLGENGELLDKATGEPIDISTGGYTRSENGEWLKDGKPVFGRQFKPGQGAYDPSKFAAGVGKDQSDLKAVAPEYGHKDNNWKQPDWMKVCIGVDSR